MFQQFLLPSLSLLKKLTEGEIESLKAAKVLLEQGKIGTDVVLLLDEVYLQKDSHYQDGRLIGADNEGNLYKGVMTFMINSLKKSIPFVIEGIPEIKIEGKWLSEHIDNCITSRNSVGFNVCAIISDNHSTNVLAFKYSFNLYGNEQKGENIINHPSNTANHIYLFFDPVHLLKNVRNNLFKSQRFIFPSFKFDQYFDPIDVPRGEISWKLLHEVYDKDEKLPANMKKTPKLSYKGMHPGDNKQSVPLALAIFDQSTSGAIESYYPNRLDASSFLKLVNIWWTINNSKQEFNTNFRIGNAAVKDGKKPLFLREFSNWLEDWQSLQSKNSQKFTLSKQINTAIVITLRCIASLIEDLLMEKKYKYVLTSPFQTDCLELSVSKYWQMSGGRFLFGLREMQVSERILAAAAC